MANVESYILKTKWGYVGITWDDKGLRQISLPDPSFTICQNRLGALRNHKNLKNVSPEIQSLCLLIKRYFSGENVLFTNQIPTNWQSLTKSQIHVLKKAFAIPYGETISYSELANRSGFPGGARFVGNTLGKNPFPLLVPCHRIVAKNRSLGGFSAPQGKSMKRKMLELENCNLFEKKGH